MEFFQVTEKVIYFRNEGELLKIEGWGKNTTEWMANAADKLDYWITAGGSYRKRICRRKGVRCGGTVRPDSCFYKKIKHRRKAGRLECIHLQRIAGWASRKLIRSMRNCFA